MDWTQVASVSEVPSFREVYTQVKNNIYDQRKTLIHS